MAINLENNYNPHIPRNGIWGYFFDNLTFIYKAIERRLVMAIPSFLKKKDASAEKSGQDGNAISEASKNMKICRKTVGITSSS